MIDSASLLAQALELRKTWLVLVPATDHAPAKRVQIRRPDTLETMQDFYGPEATAKRGGSDRFVTTTANAAKYVVGWDGFMLADVLGAAVGSGDEPAPFSPELWGLVLRDRIDWVPVITNELIEQMNLHAATQAATRKNSGPSSTARPVASKRATTGRKRAPKTR